MTKKERQEYQTRLNQATLELASIGGYIDHATRLISLQYLVGSMVASLSADIEITFERCNIKSNKIISIQKGLDDAVNKYYDFFKGVMRQESVLDWSEDMDKLEKELKKWAGIKDLRPKRKAMREAFNEIEKKYNVKLLEAK